MPLAVLLWILVLLPAVMLAWFLFAMMTEMDSDPAVLGLVILALLLILAAPNLLWYKAVRDVMSPEAAPVTLQLEK
jgi:drug/metabolite transporter (DMT)-like permease